MMAHKENDYSFEITYHSPHNDDKLFNPVFEKIQKALSKNYTLPQGYDVVVPMTGWMLQKITDPDFTIEEECKNIDIVIVDRLTPKQRAFYRDEFSVSDVYANLEKEDKPRAVSIKRYRESKCLCSRFRLDGYQIQVALARKAEDYQECSFDKYWPSDLENFYSSNLVYNL